MVRLAPQAVTELSSSRISPAVSPTAEGGSYTTGQNVSPEVGHNPLLVTAHMRPGQDVSLELWT